MNEYKLSKRKRELLDLCARLFYTYSFSGATMKILSLEAGLEPASFYSHFKSKEDILQIISNYTIDELNQGYNDILEKSGEMGLDELLDYLTEYVVHKPFYWAVLHRSNLFLDSDSEAFQKYVDFKQKITHILNNEIKSWKSKQMNPEVSLIVLCNGLSSLADIGEHKEDRLKAAEVVKEIYLNGIKQ